MDIRKFTDNRNFHVSKSSLSLSSKKVLHSKLRKHYAHISKHIFQSPRFNEINKSTQMISRHVKLLDNILQSAVFQVFIDESENLYVDFGRP